MVHSQQSRTFFTPGTLVVLSFDVRSRPVLHREGNRLFGDVGAVVAWREEMKCQKRSGTINVGLNNKY